MTMLMIHIIMVFTAWANQIKQLTPAPLSLSLTTVQYQRPDPGSSTRVSMEECCKLLQNKLKKPVNTKSANGQASLNSDLHISLFLCYKAES